MSRLFFADRWEMPARFRAPGPAGAAGWAGAGDFTGAGILADDGKKNGRLAFFDALPRFTDGIRERGPGMCENGWG